MSGEQTLRIASVAWIVVICVLPLVTFAFRVLRRRGARAAALFMAACIPAMMAANKSRVGGAGAGDSCAASRVEAGVGLARSATAGLTNLAFTAFAKATNAVDFAAAWPEASLPYGSRIELHEKLWALTNAWSPAMVWEVAVGQTNLTASLALTNGYPSTAFYSLYGDALSISFPGLVSVVRADGTRLSVATSSGEIPVSVTRSERPGGYPPSDPVFDINPFAYVHGLVYDATNATVMAESAGAFTLATGDSLLVISPTLSFGTPHDYAGEQLDYHSNWRSESYAVRSPYPLDEPCLWEGWHEGTNSEWGCTCEPLVELGVDVEAYPELSNSVVVADGVAVAKIFLGDVLVWSNSCEHTEKWGFGGRSDGLSNEGCASCGSCASGDCDTFDGPSVGSVRFRISLGSPSDGRVPGFLWFSRDEPFLLSPSSFELLSRSDAHVADTTADGVRTIVCSDRGGRTLVVTSIPGGARIDATFTDSGANDRSWEITLDGGEMRFRKFSAGGNVMSDRSYSPSGDAWSVADNVSGLVETTASTGPVLFWENGWERTVETVESCGSVTGRHVVVASGVVGWGDDALVREFERREKGAFGTWKTSFASYWDDSGYRRHGQIRMVWGDDRAWSWRDYDDEGRETFRLDQRDGSLAPNDEWCYSLEWLPYDTAAFAVATDYTPLAGDSCNPRDAERPRTESRYVVADGAATLIARTWTQYVRGVAPNGWPIVAETTIRASSQAAGIDDPGNAVSTVVRYDDESSFVPYLLRGEVVSSTDEDGVTETREYAIANGVLHCSSRKSYQSNSFPTYSYSERDVDYGLTLFESTRLTADPTVEFGWRRHVYDSRNRLRFTQYDDGSSETNDYSCCRLLSSVDRTGAKTVRTATTGQDHLYWVDEDVYNAELPKNANYYYDLPTHTAFRESFKAVQHFCDVFGRETNTVTRAGRYLSGGTTFAWPSGSSAISTTAYPEGLSDFSARIDERGLLTSTLWLSCESSEMNVIEEWLPDANSPDVVATNVAVRGGMSSTVRVADGHVVETRNCSEYASDGTRRDLSMTISDDRGVVTNSVALYDFLGRIVCVTTPLSCVSNIYEGATSRISASIDAVGGIAVTNLYDETGAEVGQIAKGVATERVTGYEFASNAWWRVESEKVCAAGATGSVRVVRTRLTGLSDELRSEYFSFADGMEMEHGISVYDPATKDLTESVVSQVDGERTRKSRFGRTVEASSLRGTEYMEYDFFGRQFVVNRLFPSLGTLSEAEIFAYNVFGDVIERYSRHARGHSSTVANNFSCEEFAYDVRGSQVSSSNANGDTIQTSRDSQGRLLAEDGDTYHTLRDYDSTGNLVALGTTRDNSSWDTTQWLSDAATGLRTAKTFADGSGESFTHAADGLPLRTTRPDGSWMENVYDGLRRLTGAESSDPSCACGLALDAFGRTVSATNAIASSVYVLSAKGLATNETATVGGVSLSLSRSEDGYGRLAGTGWGANGLDVVSYRVSGEVASVSNSDAVVEYAYDAIGDDCGCRLTLAGGSSFERILRRDPCRRELVACVTNSSAVATNSFAYSYDLVGRPVSRNADSFVYNARGEVASATVGGWTANYAYDGIGNSANYAANALNQYSAFSYSTNGEQLAFYDDAYAYDAKSRLVSAAGWRWDDDLEEYVYGVVASNRYDHLDRRVLKITPAATHTFFYDGWLLIKEVVANTNGTTDLIEYHWGKDLSGTIGGAGGVGGLLYLTISNSNSKLQLYVPWYDAYGNIMGYWDAQGNVVAEYTYNAFGKLIASSGEMADVFAFRYSTKYFDSETGLYYYGYRYYSPELMRWLTRDPIGEEGGVNLYAFCGNFAISAYDKTGLFTIYIHTDGVGHVGISNKAGTTFDYGRYHGKYSTGFWGKLDQSGPNMLIKGKGLGGIHRYTRYHFAVCPRVDEMITKVLDEKFASGLKHLPAEIIAKYDKNPGPIPDNMRYMGSDWAANNNCMTFTFSILASAAGRVGNDISSKQAERQQAMAMASLAFLSCWQFTPSQIKTTLSSFAKQNNWITEE